MIFICNVTVYICVVVESCGSIALNDLSRSFNKREYDSIVLTNILKEVTVQLAKRQMSMYLNQHLHNINPILKVLKTLNCSLKCQSSSKPIHHHHNTGKQSRSVANMNFVSRSVATIVEHLILQIIVLFIILHLQQRIANLFRYARWS